MPNTRGLLALSRTAFKNYTAYRSELLVGSITVFVSVTISVLFWAAVYGWDYQKIIAGFTLAQIITYSAISLFIARIADTGIEYEMEELVKTGNLLTWLVKPFSYLQQIFFGGLGYSIFSTVTRVVPAFILSVILYKIFFPSFYTFLFFIMSLAFSYLTVFLLSFMFGLYAFWSRGSIFAIRRVRQTATNLLSGSVIPLTFFPAWFVSAISFLPFLSVYHIPLSVYLEKISGPELFFAFGQQVIWIIILLGLSKFLWKRATKKFEALGG